MKTPWGSIAKIEADGIHSGTGFLVTKNYVLTALHVVADKTTGRPFPRIRLRFNADAEYGDGSPVFETGARIVDGGFWSIDHDFAVLECDQVPPRSKPLILSGRCRQFRRCASPGFAVQSPSGFTVTGMISSVNEPIAGGGTTVGIQFDFGSGVLMKGHSGAPVLVDDRVIGLLRTAFLDETEMTMGGIVQATSIQHVVEFCDQLRPGLLSYHANLRWPNVSPTHSRILADRKEEFSMFERMVTGRSKERVLLLKGDSGSGKTELAAELVKYARQLGIDVALADLKGCPSMDTIFRSFLFGLGQGFLPTAEGADADSRFFNMIDDLTMVERPLLLALDTWQDSSDDVRKWIEHRFLPDLDRMPGVVVLIGGQEVPDHRSASWGDLAVLRLLEPIRSADDWLEYCQRKWPSANIARQHVEAIILTAEANCRPSVISGLLDVLQGGLQARATPGASQ